MRHWILIFMIALLPLRSWVGDAMAVQMSAQPAHAALAMEGHGSHHTDHQADHSAVNQVECTCNEHAGAPDHAGHHQHNACDVCNVPALAMAVPHPQPSATVHSRLALLGEPFVSSEAQRGVKPPIS